MGVSVLGPGIYPITNSKFPRKQAVGNSQRETRQAWDVRVLIMHLAKNKFWKHWNNVSVTSSG